MRSSGICRSETQSLHDTIYVIIFNLLVFVQRQQMLGRMVLITSCFVRLSLIRVRSHLQADNRSLRGIELTRTMPAWFTSSTCPTQCSGKLAQGNLSSILKSSQSIYVPKLLVTIGNPDPHNILKACRHYEKEKSEQTTLMRFVPLLNIPRLCRIPLSFIKSFRKLMCSNPISINSHHFRTFLSGSSYYITLFSNHQTKYPAFQISLRFEVIPDRQRQHKSSEEVFHRNANE